MAKKAELGTLGNVYAVSETGEKTAKCACGMDLKVNDSTVKREYNGQTYYICSDKCAAVFDKDPKKFIDAVK
ncbi:YHS domain-containing protein [candidate division KSB1 bacterium]|nr:YHS domain-containing protein [candidate division KSB1 bacterium]